MLISFPLDDRKQHMKNLLKLSIILVALAGGFYLSELITVLNIKDAKGLPKSNCTLSKTGCVYNKISVIADKDITQPLKPTKIDVYWPNSKQDHLILTLEGYEMMMGTVIFRLNKTSQHSFTGEIILPVCTENSMTWYGQLTDGEKFINTSIRMEQ
jgi:hypothetical protein